MNKQHKTGEQIEMSELKLKRIDLSSIGGVDTGVVFDLARGYIGVLTSVRKPAALLFPWPWSAMIANEAAENCRLMQNTQRYTGLKTDVITSLTDGEFRAVWLRAAEPVAVLSRYPQDEAEREDVAQRYLALLE